MRKKIIAEFLALMIVMPAIGKMKNTQMKEVNVKKKSDIISEKFNRGSPSDTIKDTIEIDKNLNLVRYNGKIINTKIDTTGNKIQIEGTDNSIIIEQKDNSSKVKISQQGKSNKICIIQK